MVAHAGTGSQVDANLTVIRYLTRLELEALGHVVEQRNAAGHAVGDVVGEEDAILAARLGVQKGVELSHGFDARGRDTHLATDDGKYLW